MNKSIDSLFQYRMSLKATRISNEE
jgi:hypothetical protein